MPQKYYQLGGFHSPLQWFIHDEKQLSQAIAGAHSPLKTDFDAPIELVLGIKTSGTSHLLLTVDQVHHVTTRLRLQYPRAQPLSSLDFESVSPIYFFTPEELAKKLKVLKPKAQKGRPPTDNSQANKEFVSKDDGVLRGAFEHGRLVYFILQDTIDLGTYALNDKSWASSLQVCSFVFNTVLADERPSSERLTNPRVLDVGIAEATVPAVIPTSAIHIRGSWNAYLSRGKQGNFLLGTTEELDRDAANLRIREYFADKTSSNTRPTLLLVHDRQVTLNFLKNCGVDTKGWETNIKDLIGFETYRQVKPEPGPSRPNDPRRQGTSTPSSGYHGYSSRQQRGRSRSRSPPRGASGSPYKSRLAEERRSSPPRRPSSPRTYPPIYVIDILELYLKLMQTRVGSESVNAMAKQFGLGDIAEWCAGNEAFRIIDIWRSMVSGPPIDDQRAIRTIPLSQLHNATHAQAMQPDLADSDEERDPNDFAPVSTSAPIDGGGAGTYGDDDSDYGQSDSD